jgi:malate synthase
VNVAPHGFTLEGSIGTGFTNFFLPLHKRFTPEAQRLTRERAARLARAHAGESPASSPPSEATDSDWRIELPIWCADQRVVMFGAADDAERCAQLLRSGTPGIVLDLEDSMVNTWEHLMRAHQNVLDSLYAASGTVVWTRVRGLQLAQAGIVAHVPVSASLFDLALLVFRCDYARLAHPLCISIPRSESAPEALWWNDVFTALIEAKGWPHDAIKAMPTVESYPLPFELEEFLYNLREHAVGLSFGRRNYLASSLHYNFSNPAWLLPDRDKIPFDAGFLQRTRAQLTETAHKRGALAIGGLTTLYPNPADPELNARALATLEREKRIEGDSCMDGAWTGDPAQNAVAIAAFPYPNQIAECREVAAQPIAPAPFDLPRAASDGATGGATLAGTHAAIRTAIRYRNGVLEGRGASLLDGNLEDRSSDRLCRLTIAQRTRLPGTYTPQSLGAAFDEELARILTELKDAGPSTIARYRRAREISEALIQTETFDST